MPAQVAAATPEMAVEAQAVNAQDGITVFPNKEAQYRIPAIVECKSGKLIAFTDHRYHNKDIGGGRHLDIVMKTSMDKGTTWSSPERWWRRVETVSLPVSTAPMAMRLSW